MECAPSATGALYRSDATFYGDGWPAPNPERAGWAGIQTLKQVWTDIQQFLYQPQPQVANNPNQFTVWSTVHADADKQGEIIQEFDQAFARVRQLILEMGRAIQDVPQWELESDQRRLQVVLSYLVDPWSNCPNQLAAGHADVVLSVLMDLLEQLIPPWSPSEHILAPSMASNLTVAQVEPVKKHFQEWFVKLRTLAERLSRCITTVQENLPTTRLAERIERFESRYRAMETSALREEQHKRKRLLWHVQRDHTYTRDLPGAPYNVTYDNMSNGSCGYMSFVAGVGLNGWYPNPVLGTQAGGAMETQKVVRRKTNAWLRGDGVQPDVTDYHWVSVAKMRETWRTQQLAEEVRRPQQWETQVNKRSADTYWATTEDFAAMAAAFKRRIHLYLIVNEQQPANMPPVIKYFQHFMSFGDVEHRPVCIAWCKAKTTGDQYGYMRGVPIEQTNRTENHFAVILSANQPYRVPYMGGWDEGNLPYEGDADAQPFYAPKQKNVPPTPGRTQPPSPGHIDEARKQAIREFFAAYDERKEVETKRKRVRTARANLEARSFALAAADSDDDLAELSRAVNDAQEALKAAEEDAGGGPTFAESEAAAEKTRRELEERNARKKAAAEAAAAAVRRN